jgi:uncharacterized protein (TIGR00375 family)
MRQLLDLHIHSKYSRACSSALTLANLDETCRIKGVDIIATGDFTYPEWLKSIKEGLEEVEGGGLYKLKGSDGRVRFILSTEVALIYSDGGPHARRIHLVVHAPNIEAAEGLFNALDKKYNIRSDGRPILGMSAPDFVKLCLSIHPKFLVYPAHIWTPWFSVFGSKSGFDSLEECFRDQTPNIYAYETGLSSDPEMNWRVSALDGLTLLSNSDAHSLANIGRECNIFDLVDVTYGEIYAAIKAKDLSKIKGSIEFYPEEGMYHLDGHAACGFVCDPAESKKLKGLCPKCKKPLIIGVLNRVEELSDRPAGFRPEASYPFYKLVELDKIIADALGVKSRNSKKVKKEYNDLIKEFGSELGILLDCPLEKMSSVSLPRIVEGIRRVREGRLRIRPGYDGLYGRLEIFSDKERLGDKAQTSLL